MITELLVRFLLGGAVVSAFATIAEGLEPKTFAGVFGAAPSVAIASLALAFYQRGSAYVGSEASGMLAGDLALVVYGSLCVLATKHRRMPVWLGAVLSWLGWFAAALGFWLLVPALRSR
ncbi:MAG TPA: DUF3147 family protein [Polyangiaceae bacterium]